VINNKSQGTELMFITTWLSKTR